VKPAGKVPPVLEPEQAWSPEGLWTVLSSSLMLTNWRVLKKMPGHQRTESR